MRVKICGITRERDAKLAAELGAWAVGFIFFEKSPRYIRPETAAGIVASLPAGVRKVGVFVNARATEIQRIARISGIDVAQFHGEEAPEELGGVPLETIKAVRLRGTGDLARAASYRPSLAFLADADAGESWGGSGRLSDWKLARELRAHGPTILSGGLRPENVSDAILAAAPFAVDVCSGVEISPGVKARTKLEEFFRHAG